MDPTWFASQVFWVLVCFAVLYLVVQNFIAPRVGSVIEARERAINQAIAKAEELKRTADKAKGNFEAAGSEAKAKAAALIAQAQADAAKEAAKLQAELSSELEKKNEKALAALATASNKAKKELEDAALGLAQAMIEKLFSIKLDNGVKTKVRA